MSERGVGIVYAMETQCGRSYLQQVGWHPTLGSAIAVYDDDALSRYRFALRFPIGAAARRKIVTRLRRQAIPARYQPLRLRYPLGHSGDWMLVEGEQQTRVKTLSAEQVTYILAFAVNDTKLAELICAGWAEGEPLS